MLEKIKKLMFFRILLVSLTLSVIPQTFFTFSHTYARVLNSATINTSDILFAPAFPSLATERPFVLDGSENVNASPGGGNVILLSQRYDEKEFSNEIVGEVENNRTEPVEYVKVAVTFYDRRGNVLGTVNKYAYTSDLAPGMKSPFRIPVTNDLIESTKTYGFTIS
jgi:hypothetical protein